ncbi:MAG: MarR family transcriptional regulator [Burkholderiaceae bacterium]|nr:MarR family transcriptional regulator [Burkholderiaceae bacterium]
MSNKQVTELKAPESAGAHPGTCPLGQPDFYNVDDYQPEQSVGYLMRRILSTVSQEVESELEPSGLTNAQWVPLLKLYMGAASTVAEVARECQLDAGATTRLLDRLEAKGLLRRQRSSKDRRVVNLELTDDGRTAAQKIPAVLCRVQNAHLDGFTTQEWETLKNLLRRILANAQAKQAVRNNT